MASASWKSDPTAQHVAEALGRIEVTELDLWSVLDRLSTHTYVDAVEVPVEGVVIGPSDRFSAVMNLYLVLQYGRDNDEGFSQSESFRATVSGRMVDGEPHVEQSDVDVSDFYA